LTKQVRIDLVGHLHDEMSCDSGSGDRVRRFWSLVAGIGIAGMQGYKAYAGFDAADRPSGWNTWVTFSISPAATTPTTPPPPTVTK
jgi:hypothetical protein